MPRAVGRECGTLFRTYNGLPRGRLAHEFMRCCSSSSSSSLSRQRLIIISITVITRCRKQRHGAALSAPVFSQPRGETRLFGEGLLCATIRGKRQRWNAVIVRQESEGEIASGPPLRILRTHASSIMYS